MLQEQKRPEVEFHPQALLHAAPSASILTSPPVNNTDVCRFGAAGPSLSNCTHQYAPCKAPDAEVPLIFTSFLYVLPNFSGPNLL